MKQQVKISMANLSGDLCNLMLSDSGIEDPAILLFARALAVESIFPLSKNPFVDWAKISLIVFAYCNIRAYNKTADMMQNKECLPTAKKDLLAVDKSEIFDIWLEYISKQQPRSDRKCLEKKQSHGPCHRKTVTRKIFWWEKEVVKTWPVIGEVKTLLPPVATLDQFNNLITEIANEDLEKYGERLFNDLVAKQRKWSFASRLVSLFARPFTLCLKCLTIIEDYSPCKHPICASCAIELSEVGCPMCSE